MRLLNSVLLLTLLVAANAALADFKLRDLNGHEQSLAEYRGKWVVVNYWATWCPPCLEEIPELILFYDKHKDKDAVVLGMNFEDVEKSALEHFVDENMISYPVVPKVDDKAAIGPIPGLPTTYLVAPDGRIVARRVGGVTADGIEKFMREQQAQ